MARKNVVKPIVDEDEMAAPAILFGAGTGSDATVPTRSKTLARAPAASDVAATLAERGKRYGSFVGHACITQDLKLTMMKSGGWCRLDVSQKESLEMIAHKIGRILNGDPNYADSWHDIAGYAKLVEDQLTASAGK